MTKGPELQGFSAFLLENIFSNRVTGFLADESAPINSFTAFSAQG
jgi:hypothetical protein